ncbi:MAG: hypothetical protein LC749_12365 [Actinobacteria bacterium]|nr:hypothetical protein [Actinomycetota bacterium]
MTRANRPTITGHTEQPMPTNPDPTVIGAHDLVIADLVGWDIPGLSPLTTAELRTEAVRWVSSRKRIGLERYGQVLVPNDGRDGIRDAIEEAADLVAYLVNLRRQGLCPVGAYEAAVGILLDLVAAHRGITTPTPATTETPAAEPR